MSDRIAKLQSDRRAILADAEDMIRRIEGEDRDPTVYELRAFRDRIAAADRLQAIIDREGAKVPA